MLTLPYMTLLRCLTVVSTAPDFLPLAAGLIAVRSTTGTTAAMVPPLTRLIAVFANE